MKKSLLTITLVFLSVVAVDAVADIVVIAHPDTQQSAFAIKEVRNLFLAKRKTSRDGVTYAVRDLPEGRLVRDDFYLQVARKKPRQMRAHWAKLKFVGRGDKNKTLPSEAAIINWVAKSTGRLGYIDESKLTNKVKVMLRIPFVQADEQ